MKTFLLTIATVLLSAITLAQTSGINYKALIKDANGDLMANQAITFQFTVQVTNGSARYQETNTTTTDANGLASVIIGEGTATFSSFSNIDWGADDHFLSVEVDAGDGFVDLGVTQFGTVPYAMVADRAINAAFEIDLNTIRNPDENDFLIGSAAQNYVSGSEKKIFYDISKNVFRAGSINNTNWNEVNTGSDTFGFGINHKITGDNSTAFGRFMDITGDESLGVGSSHLITRDYGFAFGFSHFIDAPYSVVFGDNNSATHDFSFLHGNDLRTVSDNQTIFGSYNVDSASSLFQIANGTSDANRNTLFSIRNDGAIVSDFYEGTGERLIAADPNGKLVISTIDLPSPSSGLESITEDGNQGWRLVGKNPLNHGNIGQDAVDISNSLSTSSNGATGSTSFATGTNTIASGLGSAAFGFDSTASGNFSLSSGVGTRANGLGTMAVGLYNLGGGSPTELSLTSPVFEIGNGTMAVPSNALTVLQNGNIGIGKHTGMAGKLEIQTTSSSSSPQLVVIEDSGNFGRIQFRNNNRGGNDYWDIAGSTGTTVANDRLNFFNSDGGNILILEGNGDATLQGSLTQNSDRRLKRDIETIDYGIAEILKLNPVQYNWKGKADKPNKSLGVIAQEIQEIIPNVVRIGDDEKQTLSVSYTELIPVLIKAIQEQQKIIDAQDDKYASLEKMVMTLADKIDDEETIVKTLNVSEEK